MRAIVFQARARRDINATWDHIAADNVQAADRVADQIERAVRMLAELPGAGHIRHDVRDPRLRFWTVKRYVIAYRYTSRTLTVLRVLHGARDFRQIFGA